jgi:hypothetical protein
MIEPNLAEGKKDPHENRSACQLKSIYEGMHEIFTQLPPRDRVITFLLQQRCKMRFRMDRLLRFLRKKRTLPRETAGLKQMAGPRKGTARLKAGDRVRILPFLEIEKTLNSDGKTQGLWFMPGMKKYCGMQAKVLRKVNYIFDERAWGMVKCGNNVYLIENMFCTGEGMFDKEGCDRCCFFFWHAAWLQKL